MTVKSSRDLNSFIELLEYINDSSTEEITELTNEIWDGHGFDASCEHCDEDISNQILDESQVAAYPVNYSKQCCPTYLKTDIVNIL